MKKSEEYKEMMACPICKKRLPKTLEFFHWDEHCGRWICKQDLLTCQTCLLRYVCVECAKKLNRRFHVPLDTDIVRCEKCHREWSQYFNQN